MDIPQNEQPARWQISEKNDGWETIRRPLFKGPFAVSGSLRAAEMLSFSSSELP